MIFNKTLISSELNFLDFLKQNQERNQLAQKNQDYPFSLLLEKLNLKSQESIIPQVTFVYQKKTKAKEDISSYLFNTGKIQSVNIGGLELNPFYIPNNEGQYELTWELLESDSFMYCNLKYQTDKFDKAYIKRLEGHLKQIIESVLDKPDIKLSEIDILTPKERHQVLEEFNDTVTPYPKNKTIHQLFEEQVARTPNNIAVVFEDQKLTYQELNEKANQLAYVLRKKGVKPDTIVGIMVERSLEMMIGIMGILKAGGAYLPINPSLPEERIKYMLEDSQTNFLLTQSFLKNKFKKNIEKINLDDKEIYKGENSNLDLINKSTDLIYVIYTSGSTGKPKGVMIEHTNVHNLILSLHKLVYHQFKNPAHIAFLATYTFDASVQQIFAALLLGHQLHIISNEIKLNPKLLLKYYNQNEISVSDGTPAYLNILLSLPKKSIFNTVKKFIIGGEELKRSLIKKIHSHIQSDFQIMNVYGPTECCVDNTSYEIDKNKLPSLYSIPIGKPFRNTKVFILDKNQLPVPIGFEGEIYLAGDSIGRGYTHKELNRNVFINNFFKPNERMYKTGDFGKWLENGNIVFNGRKDNQVKIRGFRIEIAEIEAVILRYHGIKEVAVIVRENEIIGKYLVAYVVSKDRSSEIINELKLFLNTKLPDYMVPPFFIKLDQMPLNDSGKIDRKALSALAFDYLTHQTDFIAPQTETQKKLAQIWQKLLKIQKISIQDNFFESGGDSLLVIQLLLEINNTFQINMETTDILLNPSIYKISSIIDSLLKGECHTRHKIDFIKEAELDKTIHPDSKFNQKNLEINYIFITGTTGYLGSYLLAELLEQTKATIYCLVRAKDKNEGLSRLKDKLMQIDRWEFSYKTRIIPVLGDLAQMNLGVSDQIWQELCKKIDVIYHSGALVNFIYHYDQLKPPNVLGTKEVIKMACDYKTKPIYYVSTLSVFESTHFIKPIAKENDDLDHCEGLMQGYAQSKWVAEKLIKEAGHRGLPVTIFRPGRITGDPYANYMSTDDLFSFFIKGIIQLKSAPNLNFMIDLMPVNIISKSMVFSLLNKVKFGQIFHLTNPNWFKLNELVLWLNEFGYEVTILPYQDWVNRLKQDSQNILTPLLPLFITKVDNNFTQIELYSQKNYIEFSTKNTQQMLKNTNIFQFPDNKFLIKKYLEYFKKVRFLE